MPFEIIAAGLPEHLDIEEARAIPVSPEIIKRIVLSLNLPEKIKDEIATPLMSEVKKGAIENKDSVNSFIHKSVILPEKLIDESIADHFRKFGK